MTRAEVARSAAADATASVARESDAMILDPAYTVSALRQMGWQRSYGASQVYREIFTNAFVLAWQARERALRGR